MTASAPTLRLTVVLPTFNECANVEPIVTALLPLRDSFDLELLFVDDDSSDGTSEKVRLLAHRYGCVRLIRRVGRFGLSSAIKEGILDATGDVVVVMDSDGQHEPQAVARTVSTLLETGVDLVIGSRFHPEARILGLSQQRERNSTWANAVARFSLPRYRHLTDYMSGFFALRPERCLPYVRRVDVNGFKFLYELLALSHGHLAVAEVPLSFQPRSAGESKLNLAVIWDLGVSILHTLLLRMVPRRAVSFALVGGTGIGIHLMVFALAEGLLGLAFEQAQVLAVVSAGCSNYLINNVLTFRSQQLSGLPLLLGLIRFLLVTSLGMVANVGVSSAFYRQVTPQPLLALFAGIAVDFVWKYAASSRFVWNTP
ncbi:MAG: glycosyl transferase [Cyanobium sp. CACIAM 14]|nr:MAG: glycosyl transferase [Cyanobium sp. CACIAM 14]